MDAVTALSGSGPAYVFLLAEAMQAAGEAQGLPAGRRARADPADHPRRARACCSNPARTPPRCASASPRRAAPPRRRSRASRPAASATWSARAIAAATRRGGELSAANDAPRAVRPAMSLLLVRHGQASAGAADYDCLSERGVEQCRRLGPLAGRHRPRLRRRGHRRHEAARAERRRRSPKAMPRGAGSRCRRRARRRLRRVRPPRDLRDLFARQRRARGSAPRPPREGMAALGAADPCRARRLGARTASPACRKPGRPSATASPAPARALRGARRRARAGADLGRRRRAPGAGGAGRARPHRHPPQPVAAQQRAVRVPPRRPAGWRSAAGTRCRTCTTRASCGHTIDSGPGRDWRPHDRLFPMSDRVRALDAAARRLHGRARAAGRSRVRRLGRGPRAALAGAAAARGAEGEGARAGLWNLFLPHARPRADNLDYARLAERMGRSTDRAGGVQLLGARHRQHGSAAPVRQRRRRRRAGWSRCSPARSAPPSP